jgi:hypothetical protein
LRIQCAGLTHELWRLAEEDANSYQVVGDIPEIHGDAHTTRGDVTQDRVVAAAGKLIGWWRRA